MDRSAYPNPHPFVFGFNERCDPTVRPALAEAVFGGEADQNLPGGTRLVFGQQALQMFRHGRSQGRQPRIRHRERQRRTAGADIDLHGRGAKGDRAHLCVLADQRVRLRGEIQAGRVRPRPFDGHVGDSPRAHQATLDHARPHQARLAQRFPHRQGARRVDDQSGSRRRDLGSVAPGKCGNDVAIDGLGRLSQRQDRYGQCRRLRRHESAFKMAPRKQSVAGKIVGPQRASVDDSRRRPPYSRHMNRELRTDASAADHRPRDHVLRRRCAGGTAKKICRHGIEMRANPNGFLASGAEIVAAVQLDEIGANLKMRTLPDHVAWAPWHEDDRDRHRSWEVAPT